MVVVVDVVEVNDPEVDEVVVEDVADEVELTVLEEAIVLLVTDVDDNDELELVVLEMVVVEVGVVVGVVIWQRSAIAPPSM